ncbi:MAG: 30S ribosomal protein S11 [Gammaproteobacteria bacterium]|nr:30S ribosomal protein S11 [Gammaproteobacteria bacterium]
MVDQVEGTETPEKKEEQQESQQPVQRRRLRAHVADGIAHIHASFTNTIITLTDRQGNTISWASAGGSGFRGSRKSQGYSAQIAAERAATRAIENYGMVSVDVRVKGPGLGRESSIRALNNKGLRINSITDLTPLPHNGCQPPKKRRI